MKNAKIFCERLQIGNLQEMTDSRGNFTTVSLTCWDKILVECFNEAFREGEMSISQKRGVVTLLPKEESDLADLSNWRPDKDSVRRVIAVLKDFGDLSGFRLNPSKTKALWLGPWRHCKEKPSGFKWPERPIRAFGIFFSYDTKQNGHYNSKTKYKKLKHP